MRPQEEREMTALQLQPDTDKEHRSLQGVQLPPDCKHKSESKRAASPSSVNSDSGESVTVTIFCHWLSVICCTQTDKPMAEIAGNDFTVSLGKRELVWGEKRALASLFHLSGDRPFTSWDCSLCLIWQEPQNPPTIQIKSMKVTELDDASNTF